MTGAADSKVLTARLIIPVDRGPMPGGKVTIAADRIIAVTDRGERSADIDLGNVAILPGLVNAHTHLDLTGLHGRVPPSPDFAGWIRSVVRERRIRQPAQVQQDIATGITSSMEVGTTLLGDIAAGGQSWDQLASAPLRAVVFHEMLGLSKERAQQSFATVCAWLRAHPPRRHTRPGLSPHAPYSVRNSLFEAVARLASAQGLPSTIHLAESSAELELLSDHRGPFVSFLEEMGIYDPSGLIASPEAILAMKMSASPLLIAHGTYLRSPTGLGGNGSIVYCPRTHQAFGHAPYPLTGFLASGVRIALGTDSLASNPDLNILEEAKFVRRSHPTVAPDAILRMATLAGAEALGWASETGSLAPGKAASLTVVRVPDRNALDPGELILDDSARVIGVMIDGNWFKDPRQHGA
jgi:aminodeoxyfutalosine deaminase